MSTTYLNTRPHLSGVTPAHEEMFKLIQACLERHGFWPKDSLIRDASSERIFAASEDLFSVIAACKLIAGAEFEKIIRKSTICTIAYRVLVLADTYIFAAHGTVYNVPDHPRAPYRQYLTG